MSRREQLELMLLLIGVGRWAWSRGFARHHIGQYWEAIGDFTAVIEHNPSHGFAYGNRGMSFYKLGRRAAAEEDFVRSIEVLTHDIQAYIDNSYSLVKRYDRWIGSLDWIETLMQSLRLSRRGMCFLMVGKYAEGTLESNPIINPTQSSMQCNAMQCNAIQSNAIQCNPIINPIDEPDSELTGSR